MDMLRVQGGKIVDAEGNPVRLRGVCVGGWMNMEHFINGYPGAEHGLRATMARILGPEKAQFFFDRMLDYVLAREDIAFLKQCGATVVRLPLNYRHFERDDAPFEYLEAGFARLDRALAWCTEYGVYAILDLHAVQGWQSTDWHCDNSSRHSFFWSHRQFQDRFVALWQEFARRFEDNSAIAGYNVMNEPLTNAPAGRFSERYTPDWAVMNRVYRRVVEAIRAIDPDHLVFLEGDYFSTLFDGLDAPFADNLVYSSHNYNAAGFGPGPYPSAEWNRERQVEVLMEQQGSRFAQRHNVPLWVGEFGAMFNGPPAETPDRVRAMDDQIDVFEEYGAHWTIWTYKDIGTMGAMLVPPDAPYVQAIDTSLKAKHELALDMFWMPQTRQTRTREMIVELARHLTEQIDDPDIDPAPNTRYLAQAALAGYASSLAQPAYAKCFEGMSEDELERVLQSFAFENCRPNRPLIDVLTRHMTRPQ
jgi:endoglucanase